VASSGSDFAQVGRHRVPQGFFEHDEARADFVERRDPTGARFVTLPGRRDLAPQTIDRIVVFHGRQIDPIAKREDRRDAVVLLNQRAPDDFGRMRGQHELDARRNDGVGERVWRDAGADQPRERLGARAALGVPVGVARVIAPAARPVVLLRDVGQRQEVREGARDGHGGFDGHVAQNVGEQIERSGFTGMRGLRDRAHPLHAIEERVAFVYPQRLAEQLTEQVNVVSQRFVRVGGHALRVLRGGAFELEPRPSSAS